MLTIKNPDQKIHNWSGDVLSIVQSEKQEIVWARDKKWGEVLILDGDPQIAQNAHQRYQQGLLGVVLEAMSKANQRDEKRKKGAILGGGDGLFRIELQKWSEQVKNKKMEIEAVEWDEVVLKVMEGKIEKWAKKEGIRKLLKTGIKKRESIKKRVQVQQKVGCAWDWVESKRSTKEKYNWIAVDLIDPQDREWIQERIKDNTIRNIKEILEKDGILIWQMGSGRDFSKKTELKKQWSCAFRWIMEWTVKGELQDQVFWMGTNSKERFNQVREVIKKCQKREIKRRPIKKIEELEFTKALKGRVSITQGIAFRNGAEWRVKCKGRDGARGVHWIGDAKDCTIYEYDQKGKGDVERWLRVEEEAKKWGAIVLREHRHCFEPQGMTGFLLLGQSHVSVHTWPEHKMAAWDMYVCHEGIEGRKMIEGVKRKIEEEWGVKVWEDRWIERL